MTEVQKWRPYDAAWKLILAMPVLQLISPSSFLHGNAPQASWQIHILADLEIGELIVSLGFVQTRVANSNML